jgi:hypothetical protein
MDVNQDGYYSISHSRLLRPLLRSPLLALAVHWIFQGMLYMDRTERLFKLGLDLLWTAALAPALFLGAGLRLQWALPLAFGLAHTLNLLLNGQIWVVLKHFGLVRHTREEFEEVMDELAARVTAEPSIAYAAVYGSLARGKWDETSDLDVRLVRVPGWRAAWRVCWFAMRERTRAFWLRFPLDLFILDDHASLAKLSEKHTPLVLGGTEAKHS